MGTFPVAERFARPIPHHVFQLAENTLKTQRAKIIFELLVFHFEHFLNFDRDGGDYYKRVVHGCLRGSGVEHFLGKEEVAGSIPAASSI